MCPDGDCVLIGNPDYEDIFELGPSKNGDVDIIDVEPADIIRFRVREDMGEVKCAEEIRGWELAFYSVGPYTSNLTAEGHAEICW